MLNYFCFIALFCRLNMTGNNKRKTSSSARSRHTTSTNVHMQSTQQLHHQLRQPTPPTETNVSHPSTRQQRKPSCSNQESDQPSRVRAQLSSCPAVLSNPPQANQQQQQRRATCNPGCDQLNEERAHQQQKRTVTSNNENDRQTDERPRRTTCQSNGQEPLRQDHPVQWLPTSNNGSDHLMDEQPLCSPCQMDERPPRSTCQGRSQTSRPRESLREQQPDKRRLNSNQGTDYQMDKRPQRSTFQAALTNSIPQETQREKQPEQWRPTSNRGSDDQMKEQSFPSTCQTDKSCWQQQYQMNERPQRSTCNGPLQTSTSPEPLRGKYSEQRRPTSNHGNDRQMDERTQRSAYQASLTNSTPQQYQQEQRQPTSKYGTDYLVDEQPLCSPCQTDERPSRSTCQRPLQTSTHRESLREQQPEKRRPTSKQGSDHQMDERQQRATYQNNGPPYRSTCQGPLQTSMPPEPLRDEQQGRPRPTSNHCSDHKMPEQPFCSPCQIDEPPYRSPCQTSRPPEPLPEKQPEQRRPVSKFGSDHLMGEQPLCSPCQTDEQPSRSTYQRPLQTSTHRESLREQQPEKRRPTSKQGSDHQMDERPQRATYQKNEPSYRSTCQGPLQTSMPPEPLRDEQQGQPRPTSNHGSDHQMRDQPICSPCPIDEHPYRSTHQGTFQTSIPPEPLPEEQPEQWRPTSKHGSDHQMGEQPLCSPCQTDERPSRSTYLRPLPTSTQRESLREQQPDKRQPTSNHGRDYQVDKRHQRSTYQASLTIPIPQETQQENQPEKWRPTSNRGIDDQTNEQPLRSTCHGPLQTLTPPEPLRGKTTQQSRPTSHHGSDRQMDERPICQEDERPPQSTDQTDGQPYRSPCHGPSKTSTLQRTLRDEKPEERRRTSKHGSDHQMGEQPFRSTCPTDRSCCQSPIKIDRQPHRSIYEVPFQTPTTPETSRAQQPEQRRPTSHHGSDHQMDERPIRSTCQLYDQPPKPTCQADEQPPQSTGHIDGQPCHSTCQGPLQTSTPPTTWRDEKPEHQRPTSKHGSDHQIGEQPFRSTCPTDRSCGQSPSQMDEQPNQPTIQVPLHTSTPQETLRSEEPEQQRTLSNHGSVHQINEPSQAPPHPNQINEPAKSTEYQQEVKDDPPPTDQAAPQKNPFWRLRHNEQQSKQSKPLHPTNQQQTNEPTPQPIHHQQSNGQPLQPTYKEQSNQTSPPTIDHQQNNELPPHPMYEQQTVSHHAQAAPIKKAEMEGSPSGRKPHVDCACSSTRNISRKHAEPLPVADTYTCSRPRPVFQEPKKLPGADCTCKVKAAPPMCGCSAPVVNHALEHQHVQNVPRTHAQISCGQRPPPYRQYVRNANVAPVSTRNQCASRCGHCQATHKSKKGCVIQ